MAYFETDLSVPHKAVISDPISGGRAGIWASILISVFVGEGGVFGGGIRLLGACGIGSRGCFGIGCFRG